MCWPRFTTVDGTPITELMDEAAVASVVQRCVKGGAESGGLPQDRQRLLRSRRVPSRRWWKPSSPTRTRS